MEFWKNYWSCDTQQFKICQCLNYTNIWTCEYKDANLLESDANLLENDANEEIESVKQRRRRSSLPDIDANLFKLLKLITSNKSVEFTHIEKSSRGLHNGLSNRRSRFVGVLKNGNRWQVLINVGRVKKYIGTYKFEKDAAIGHDFYSIGINGKKGKTNFSYSKDLIEWMINSYFENDRYFDPTLFSNQIESSIS